MSKLLEGPVRLFPQLYDISGFVIGEHPKYHPLSLDYETYWTSMERRCLEGTWEEDRDGELGGWRYMPGFLFYYANICKIIDESDDGGTTVDNPLLRDVEWVLSYAWMTARGFSGFEHDNEFTCNRLVLKQEEGKELTPKEQISLNKDKYTLKKDGSPKKYVEAREYLYRTHNDNMGKALYNNFALNLMILGARGFGKSFFAANAIIGHEFNFYGKKYYNETYLDNPSPVEIFVGAALASKSTDLLKKFTLSQEYIKKEVGAYGSGEEFIPGFFHNNTTGSLRPNSSYEHKYASKVGGTWVEEGTGTKIAHGVYTTENPQAAVGTRPTVMAIEEVGLVGNLLSVHGANETCMIRTTKFGSAVYFGTAGNMEKITEPKIIFEDPEAYNMVPFKDSWENRTKPIGLFMPAYYVDNSFKDKNGNTNLQLAFEQEIIERTKRQKAKNSAALDEYMMARPLIPSEMFLTASGNFFPVAKLRERLIEVEVSNIFEKFSSVGMLHFHNDRKIVRWEEDVTRKKYVPITGMNLDAYKSNMFGAIVIYEHPTDSMPEATYDRALYKITYDPVKDDNGGTSLASILVYKSYVDKTWESEEETLQHDLVAEFIGRPDRVEDIHDIAIKLALYFNAKVMVENNLPDFIRYCSLKKCRHILQPTPWLAISKVIANPTKKYQVGVSMNQQLNVQCEQLIRNLLLEDWIKGEEEFNNKYFLHKLKSPRLLKELIEYDRERNFDHVSSLKLLALWLSQEIEQPITQAKKTDRYKDIETFYNKHIKGTQKENPYYAY